MSPSKWRVRRRLTSYGLEWMVHAPRCILDSGRRCRAFDDHADALAYAIRKAHRAEPPC